MNDSSTTISDLKKSMLKFVKERDWSQFHTPKNLAMALSQEASELLELFIWVESSKAEKHLEKNREAVEQEVADVFSYLLSFCSQNNIDLSAAFERKLALNREKYPINKSNELVKKYTEL